MLEPGNGIVSCPFIPPVCYLSLQLPFSSSSVANQKVREAPPLLGKIHLPYETLLSGLLVPDQAGRQYHCGGPYSYRLQVQRALGLTSLLCPA